jgi:hypothetical protein
MYIFVWQACAAREDLRSRLRWVEMEREGAVESMRSACRGVAQPGSAPALGAGGPRFKSGRPDQSTSYIPGFFLLNRIRAS